MTTVGVALGAARPLCPPREDRRAASGPAAPWARLHADQPGHDAAIAEASFAFEQRLQCRVFEVGHALLTNIVLAWNTARMHEMVERLERDGIPVEDDWLRRTGPAHFAHINFRGTMRFGVEKFAAALIQRVPDQATRSAS